jgi:hypothetical protein
MVKKIINIELKRSQYNKNAMRGAIKNAVRSQIKSQLSSKLKNTLNLPEEDSGGR